MRFTEHRFESSKISERILAFLMTLFAAGIIFLSFSCGIKDEDSALKEEISDGFTFSACTRNGSAYLWWTGLAAEKTILDFEKVLIEYETSPGENEKIVISKENGGRQKHYIISNLENGKEYLVKFTGFIGGQPYSQSLKIVPQKLEFNFERTSAIIADGKVFVTFTLADFEDSEKNSLTEPDIKTVNLYFADEKLFGCEAAASLAHEKIDSSVSEDDTKTYRKYYSIVVDESDYAYENRNFELRIMNSSGVESEPKKLSTKKSGLPVVNIEIEDFSEEKLAKFKDKKKIDANLAVLNYDGTKTSAPLTIKGRGNSSWNNAPKKSYTIKFEKKQNFLDLGENKSFALIANYFDKTLLRNQASYELGKTVFNKMPWNPGAKCVNLFVNNVYQGVYLAAETVKISKNRINIPDISGCNDAEKIDEYGFVLEVDTRQDENFVFKTEKGVPFSLKEPDAADFGAEIKEEIEDSIKRKVQSAEDALYSGDFSWLDLDSFADWWLLEELSKNTDSNFYSSCYMYFNPEKKKFFMGPVWDFDLGWGNINAYDTFGASVQGFKAEETVEKSGGEDSLKYESWIVPLMKNLEFREKARSRWNELKPKIEEYFGAEENADSAYEKHFAALASSHNDAALNFERWPILGKSVWKSPADCESRKTYKEEKDFFIEWKNARVKWLSSAL